MKIQNKSIDSFVIRYTKRQSGQEGRLILQPGSSTKPFKPHKYSSFKISRRYEGFQISAHQDVLCMELIFSATKYSGEDTATFTLDDLFSRNLNFQPDPDSYTEESPINVRTVCTFKGQNREFEISSSVRERIIEPGFTATWLAGLDIRACYIVRVPEAETRRIIDEIESVLGTV